jgi:hypothetical protein
MFKRKKSGVPDGTLVGQIPLDDRWKFNSYLDVDPYPYKSSCSICKSGIIQVNTMNFSAIFYDRFQRYMRISHLKTVLMSIILREEVLQHSYIGIEQ